MEENSPRTRGSDFLYLHFPFCERKCRYCDFLSGPASEEVRKEYVELLCREISGGDLQAQAERHLARRCGYDLHRRRNPFPHDTCAGFPRDGGSQRFLLRHGQRGDQHGGQSRNGRPHQTPGVPGSRDQPALDRRAVFDDAELKLLGRIHTADQAREIFRAAREAGFDNINLDLMSALPGQNMETWSRHCAKPPNWSRNTSRPTA